MRVEPNLSTSTARSTVAPASTATSTTKTTTTTTTTIRHDPAHDFVLNRVATVTGAISPKSVTATGTGLVFAKNMMYRHTMTVHDAGGALVKTIPDGVDLAKFGVAGHPGVSRGAPVERPWTTRTATCSRPTTRCSARTSAPRVR